MVRTLTGILILMVGTAHGQVRFTPNKGQWPDHVHHRAEVRGGGIQLETDGWTCWQWQPHGNGPMSNGHRRSARQGILWHAELIGAQPRPEPEWQANEVDPDRSNFYVSNDPDQWAEGVQSAGRIQADDLWEGVSMRWRSTGMGNAKFEFTVAPGADPNHIAWRYHGVQPVADEDGRLRLQHAEHDPSLGFSAHLEPPFAFQLNRDGRMTTVPCTYVVDDREIRLSYGAFDPALPLVVDPEIVFASYIGATGDNWGTTACNGPDAALVAASIVFAPGYPVTTDALQSSYDQTVQGDSHVGLSIFSPDGDALLYSTYLGGDHYDIPHSLAFDPLTGTIAIMGSTGSLDFPVTANAYQSTHAPGVPEFGQWGIPYSPNSPGDFDPEEQPQGTDYFLSSLNAADFTLIGSTYFGGNDSDGWNTAPELYHNFGDIYRGQLDFGPDGSIWLAGCTRSTDLVLPGSPPHAGQQDGLIAGFSNDLSNLIAGRYFGGSENDAAYGISVAADGSFGGLGNLEVLVGGGTASFNLPLPPGSYLPGFSSPTGVADGWVGLFTASATGIQTDYATYHGRDTYDQVYFVDRGTDGSPYAFGQAHAGLPVIGSVYSNADAGQYVTRFFDDLSDITWQTNIGSGMNAIDISPTAFLISDCNQIYLSGWGGSTNFAGGGTADLPTTPDAFQSSTDGSDFYLAVLSPDAEELVYATYVGGPNTAEHNDGGSCRFDDGGTVYHSACASCYSWDDFPTTPGAWSETDPSPTGTTAPTNSYNASNPFSTSCNMGVFKFALGSLNAAIDLDTPGTLCIGNNVQFANNTPGNAVFTWDFGDGVFSNEAEPEHLFGIPGTYEVILIAEDPLGCLASDTAYIDVVIEPDADPAVAPFDPLCLGDDMQLQGSGNGTLSWAPPIGLSNPNIANPIADPITTTTYTLTDATACNSSSVDVIVEVIDMATTASDDTQICLGSSTPISISSLNPAAATWDYVWSPAAGLSDPLSAAPLASPVTPTLYTATVTTPEGCERTHDVAIDVVSGPPGGNTYPDVSLCIGTSTTLLANPGNTWSWSPTEGLDDPSAQDPSASPNTTTQYSVSISNICGSGTDEVLVDVIVPEAFAGPDGILCAGEPYTLTASGGVSYHWFPMSNVTNPYAANTTAITEISQVFTVYVTDANGCVDSDEVEVTVWPRPVVNAGPDQQNAWLEPTFLYGSVTGQPYDSLWWTPSEGLSCSDCLIPELILQDDGAYTLHVIDTNGCRSSDDVMVSFTYPLYIPSGFTPNGDGLNDGWRPEGYWLNGAGTYILGQPDATILPGYRLEIWDRWGGIVWATEDPRAYWTGSVGGPGTAQGSTTIGGGAHYAPNGIYQWKVWIPTQRGIETRQGTVNLFR